ncbi:MAG: hypothetical protein LBQ68_03580 [Clostridiales bacterium]|jgi:hypothetical protein|nr:hypothetical protein [Clostridiales bacterium]
MKIRVLEHSADDSIRIGAAFGVADNAIAALMTDIMKSYCKKFNRSATIDDFAEICDKYYKHIAIVNSETLSVINEIFKLRYGEKN